MPVSNAHLVAVYGTLKQGFALHSHLNRDPIDTQTLVGFEMFDLGWYPGIFHSPYPDETIHVELYEVDDDELELLDQVEGAPSLYVRKQVRTKHGNAWIYIKTGTPEGCEKVESGEWLKK